MKPISQSVNSRKTANYLDNYRVGLTRIPEDYYSRGYNLIDGHHRLDKAKKYEVTALPAYIIRMEQHISFMTEGFEAYVGYWNGKLQSQNTLISL
ncbi:hypothetical protein Q5O14_10340 [Eubacteriaceae bacterium ES2]|nr:hypothetical protein Q5O14_10340 [Eubacteriaceae bacterium ES2]